MEPPSCAILLPWSDPALHSIAVVISTTDRRPILIFSVCIAPFQPDFFIPPFFSKSLLRISSPWAWQCKNDVCQRAAASTIPQNLAMSLSVCKLTCYNSFLEFSMIWPKPTSKPDLSKEVIPIRADRISFTKIAFPAQEVYITK